MPVDPSNSLVPRVLLAEDSEPCQNFVCIVLRQAGIAVDVVWNGAAAIEALSKTDYSLVLMDCQMPVMGGAEATRLIRSGTSGALNPDIPIIAITANAFPSNASTCLLAGMNDYIIKPVSRMVLLASIQKWLMPEPKVEDADSKTACS